MKVNIEICRKGRIILYRIRTKGGLIFETGRYDIWPTKKSQAKNFFLSAHLPFCLLQKETTDFILQSYLSLKLVDMEKQYKQCYIHSTIYLFQLLRNEGMV
jgi:hypothetical protein